jgi:hypothetical protein
MTLHGDWSWMHPKGVFCIETNWKQNDFLEHKTSRTVQADGRFGPGTDDAPPRARSLCPARGLLVAVAHDCTGTAGSCVSLGLRRNFKEYQT